MHETLQVQQQGTVWRVRLHRPQASNTINSAMVGELSAVLKACEPHATVVVVEGSPDVFCLGADFAEISSAAAQAEGGTSDPGPLYDVWTQLATGPFVSIAHVRGRANAGGIGFVAACDIVLADATAEFSLSELLFGVYPACVLPYLVRRIGFQHANYLTLTTQPITVQQACDWGLVDVFDKDSDALLRRHLLRLRRLSKVALVRYKSYVQGLHGSIPEARGRAIAANVEAFSDPGSIRGIVRYVERGLFPWEAEK